MAGILEILVGQPVVLPIRSVDSGLLPAGCFRVSKPIGEYEEGARSTEYVRDGLFIYLFILVFFWERFSYY